MGCLQLQMSLNSVACRQAGLYQSFVHVIQYHTTFINAFSGMTRTKVSPSPQVLCHRPECASAHYKDTTRNVLQYGCDHQNWHLAV